MGPATLAFLKLVPRNHLSRTGGLALRGPWPKAVHQAVIRWFVRRYDVDVSEADRPLRDYPTFNAFFTRALREGARPVAPGADVLVSPSDGGLGAYGTVEAGDCLQAKGRPYSLSALVGGGPWAERFAGGTFVTIYLAPWNYHRVHAPLAGAVAEAVHVPGTLWPVNPPAVEAIEDLFAVNERIATFLETDAGAIGLVMVGATMVGRIRMRFDELVSNAGRDLGRRRYDPPRRLGKGDELGVFEMGSTVVLLFEPGRFELAEGLAQGDRLRMGQVLGKIRPAPLRP